MPNRKTKKSKIKSVPPPPDKRQPFHGGLKFRDGSISTSRSFEKSLNHDQKSQRLHRQRDVHHEQETILISTIENNAELDPKEKRATISRLKMESGGVEDHLIAKILEFSTTPPEFPKVEVFEEITEGIDKVNNVPANLKTARDLVIKKRRNLIVQGNSKLEHQKLISILGMIILKIISVWLIEEKNNLGRLLSSKMFSCGLSNCGRTSC